MNGAPPARRVTGVDMADAMLQRGRAKVDHRSAGRAVPLAIAFARADVTRAVVHAIVPLVGRLVSGHGRAYSYLPRSMDAFPSGPAFVARLERAGFADAGFEALAPGLVCLYAARRAPV